MGLFIKDVSNFLKLNFFTDSNESSFLIHPNPNKTNFENSQNYLNFQFLLFYLKFLQIQKLSKKF